VGDKQKVQMCASGQGYIDIVREIIKVFLKVKERSYKHDGPGGRWKQRLWASILKLCVLCEITF
jgi:hypothetical protein